MTDALPAITPEAQALLAQSKAAMGGAAWDRICAISQQAVEEITQLKGQSETVTSLCAQRLFAHTHVGPFERARGYDGRDYWISENDNYLLVHSPPSSEEVDKLYVAFRAWWYPSRWAAKIETAGQLHKHGRTYQILRIEPQGGSSLDLWIDAQTHEVAGWGTTDDTGRVTTLWEDYRTVQGVRLAFRTETINEALWTRQVSRTTQIVLNAPIPTGAYAVPAIVPALTFPSDAHEIKLPFRLEHGYIYLSGTIQGRSFRFMLDTAGGNVISPEVARQLGLVEEGHAVVRGLGAGHGRESFTRVKRLSLGPAISLENQTFSIAPLMPSVQAAGGTSLVAAISGPALFNGYVARIDYAHRSISLIRPDAFRPDPGAIRLPLRTIRGLPAVWASIDGIAGWFLLDTGANALMHVLAPFAQAHDLYKRLHAKPAATMAHGYAGKIQALEAHDQLLQLGPFHARLLMISLGTDRQGVNGATGMAGIIGSSLLQHLVITLDEAHHVVYIKPAPG